MSDNNLNLNGGTDFEVGCGIVQKVEGDEEGDESVGFIGETAVEREGKESIEIGVIR